MLLKTTFIYFAIFCNSTHYSFKKGLVNRVFGVLILFQSRTTIIQKLWRDFQIVTIRNSYIFRDWSLNLGSSLFSYKMNSNVL